MMTSTSGRRGSPTCLPLPLPLLLATTALLATVTLAYDRTLRIDFPGPYCRVRNQCCSDRQDNCSRAIAQTLCYCDEFCDRHEPIDCCPDYHSYCRNEPDPIISCLHNGIYFNIFNRTLDNCNQCLCLEGGRVVCDQDVCLTDNEVVRRVNNMHDLGWTARVYQQWWGHKYSEGLSKRLGAKVPSERIKSMRKLANSATGLPRAYNVLDRWSLYLKPIHDQGWCGSSWAVSAASVASDRFAIQSHGMEVVQLSSQNIISCALTQDGCKGGHLDSAWRYLHKKGVLNETCYAYREANGVCMVVNETLRGNGCISFVGRDSLYKMGPPYALKGERDIMAEIFKSGPLQATMHVYRDFFAYASGVYQKSPDHRGAPSGFHAVKLIGWGEEPNGKKYWIGANSWGTWWGEGGYFRIRRGVNECGIEDFALAAWPNLLRYYNFRSAQFNRNR